MSISLDNISYFKIKDIPDPKNLICCICYCLVNKNGKQCKNSKCLKIYCEDCCLKLKFQNIPCSYCRISKEYIGLDSSIINCLDNLLFYCIEFDCKGQYTLEEYKLNHMHNNDLNDNKNSIKCKICEFIMEKNPNYLVCNICNEKCCYRNLEYIPYKISKSVIKKFLDKKEICMKRCINCLLPVCNKCNIKYIKYKLNNFICEYCEITCFICNNNSLTFCDLCHKSICENCMKIDSTNNLILCNNDYESNNNKENIKKYYVLEKYSKCPLCKNKIEDINDLVKCKEAKCENKFICYKCSLFCNICKKIICKTCGLYCDQCPCNDSLVSCKLCNSNTIKKCFKENCNKKLCINCYNSCNKCNIILCDEHKNQCLSCEDVMCDNHFSICRICDKEGYKKACLKKCTFKCSFCDNMNNELCNKKNHEKNFVQKYNCEHYICLQCVKKCEICKKIVKSCLRCTVDYNFEYCQFCDKYKCFSCGNQCKKCEDYFCDYEHICDMCSGCIKKNTCLKCVNISRMKCLICKKNLRQCDDCKKILVCSKECYLKNKNKNKKYKEHLCQMFICDDCIKKNNVNINNISNFEDSKENNELISLKVKEFINNNTSGRKINRNNNNDDMNNIFNNQINPNLNNNIIFDSRKNNNNDNDNGLIKEGKKKALFCDTCSCF